MTLAKRLTAALDHGADTDHQDEAAFGVPDTIRTAAAVLIPIIDQPQPGVILTQRPQWLRSHAGQVAFPGGKVDPGDVDAVDTALREAEEELGLVRRDVTVIGTTQPYHSGSGFRITPVIAVVPPGLMLDPNPDEVEAWFEVPAATLFDPARYATQQAWWKGQDRTYHELLWQERRIWGVTAGIILNLARRLRLVDLFA